MFLQHLGTFTRPPSRPLTPAMGCFSSRCYSLIYLHAALWEERVSPKHQVTATGNSTRAPEIGCCLHYGDILRIFKSQVAEKYVLTYEKALIFTVLTFLSDSLRILSLIWMHYSRLLYLFWYFKRLQGALHLKIIGLFTHPVPFNWHICLLEHFIIILGIIKSSPVPKFMKKKCSPTVCSLTHNGMSAIIWV